MLSLEILLPDLRGFDFSLLVRSVLSLRALLNPNDFDKLLLLSLLLIVDDCSSATVCSLLECSFRLFL